MISATFSSSGDTTNVARVERYCRTIVKAHGTFGGTSIRVHYKDPQDTVFRIIRTLVESDFESGMIGLHAFPGDVYLSCSGGTPSLYVALVPDIVDVSYPARVIDTGAGA